MILKTTQIALLLSTLTLSAGAQSTSITDAPQGHTVVLPDLKAKEFPRISYSITPQESPQYLISDDPEYIRVPEAAAMREAVDPGLVRLYVYNVNGVKEPEEIPRKITAVLRNMGSEPMQFTMKRRAFPTPSGNYFHIGKTGLYDFMSEQPDFETVTIPAGEAVPVDQEMENFVTKYNDLVHGFYEFEIDQPGQVTVLQTDPETSGPEADARLTEVLPTKSKSGAGRGKFLTNNFEVKTALDTARGPVQLVVADGQDDDWVVGTEATIDEEAVLKGNYGVMYNIEIEWSSRDGKGLALLSYNERFGSQWCGAMAMAMTVSDGEYPGGVVMVPSNQLNTKSAPEYVLIQRFPAPPEGETSTINLTYSPPGASCLPTPLLLVPYEMVD